MRQKTRILIYILIAIAVVIMGTLAILQNHQAANKPVTAQEHIDLGRIYLTELSYEKAVLEFTEAIEIEPLNPDAYLGLAEAYAGMGDIEKAIEILENGYDITGDEHFKEMLKKLCFPEETEAIITSIIANTVATELSRETGTSNIEADIREEAIKYADMINTINNSSEITITMNINASNSIIDDTNLLYLPEFFYSNIVEQNNNELYQFYHFMPNNFVELIYPYGDFFSENINGEYILQKVDSNNYPMNLVNRNYIINKNFFISNKDVVFSTEDPSGIIFNIFPFVYFTNTNMQYYTLSDNNNNIYNIYGDGSKYIDYLCGEKFKCFYRKYISDDIISFDFWTDICKNSYTLYSINNGTVNGKGNFIINKYIITLRYPNSFDVSLWDKIHKIDEVKSVINN